MTRPSPLTLSQTLRPQVALQGRLTAVKWISMSEPEVAREVLDIEADPLFGRLMYASAGRRPVLHRRRWPASRLHSGFYELNEASSASPGSASIQDILEAHKRLLKSIRRIGPENFERYFLYGEDRLPLGEICSRLSLKENEAREMLDLVLEVGARSEFFRPPPPPGQGRHCIARIEIDARDPENLFFQFLSPHWARGRYEVDYEKLEQWKRENSLASEERRRLRRLLNRIELLNMRQDTLFQILSRIVSAQSAFLRSRLRHRMRPLTLRELSRRLGVAPSTVSRAVGGRCVELPWGVEVPLKSLLSGQRSVVLAILLRWRANGEIPESATDERLMRRLANECGISVSRRTVNECRRKLADLMEQGA
jgi:hypothetical protein